MARVEFIPRYYVDSQGRYLGAFAGLAQPPSGAIEVSQPPGPDYRQRRMVGYADQLGKDPGDIIKTLGDVLDVLIAQVEAMRVASGASATTEYAAMLTKIAAIKAAHPRPS